MWTLHFTITLFLYFVVYSLYLISLTDLITMLKLSAVTMDISGGEGKLALIVTTPLHPLHCLFTCLKKGEERNGKERKDEETGEQKKGKIEKETRGKKRRGEERREGD